MPMYQVLITNEGNASIQSAYKCNQIYETSAIIDDVVSHSMRIQNVRLTVLDYIPIDSVEYLFTVEMGGGSSPPLAYYYADVEPSVQSYKGVKISDEGIASINEDTENIIEVFLDNEDPSNITYVDANSYCQLCFLFRVKEPGFYKYVIEADYTIGDSDSKTIQFNEQIGAFLDQAEYNNKVTNAYTGMIQDVPCMAVIPDLSQLMHDWYPINSNLSQDELHSKLQKHLPDGYSILEEYCIHEKSELFAIVKNSSTEKYSLWFVSDADVVEINSYETYDTIEKLDASNGPIFLAKSSESSSKNSPYKYSIIENRYGFPITFKLYNAKEVAYLGNDLFELTVAKSNETGKTNYTTEAVWNGLCFVQK